MSYDNFASKLHLVPQPVPFVKKVSPESLNFILSEFTSDFQLNKCSVTTTFLPPATTLPERLPALPNPISIGTTSASPPPALLPAEASFNAPETAGISKAIFPPSWLPAQDRDGTWWDCNYEAGNNLVTPAPEHKTVVRIPWD
ncbi:hypothetical protein MJO28_014011 [Puccinia striiformis f. sp. tritici]|uniref:Uncharacterized protein n=1 Tax=Puccinia striiformis f. sp. tritici TaxID=168172 RepID=A0ACC0DWC4_9BASI|nr:hypothetical protein MJO28_014011 [Puccinia striiformis f. sp. tritici]